MKFVQDKTLASHLWSLAKQTTSKVEEHRTKGLLVQIRSVYIKPKVENFTYKEGSTGFQTSYSNVERQEWHWKDQHDFIEEIIKKFSEYQKCLQEIEQKYNVTTSQANFWLSRFCQSFAYKAIDPVAEEAIVEDVTTFISDLENSQTDWFAKAWIEGMWLSDEGFNLNSRALLRKPRPDDFEEERPFDLVPVLDPFSFHGAPSAVLEITTRGKSINDVQEEIELMLGVFRLFRLGGVSTSKVQLSPRSFLRFGGTLGSNFRFAASYKYGFKKEDVSDFSALQQKLAPILPRPFVPASDKIDPIDIAFQRYQDALLQPISVEGRITSAITCLEALYLKAEERMELSHRLSQRVSSLLRFFGFIPLEAYKNLNLSYEIRSKFIHGSPLDKDERQNSTKLCETVLEYSRISLLVFFQLRAELPKETIISKLDNSLLDENAVSKIRDLLTTKTLVTR